MSKLSHKPRVSAELRNAFAQAIVNFADWNMGGPEPRVSYEMREHSLTGIFMLVAAYSRPMSKTIMRPIRDLAAEFRNGEEALDHDCSGPKHQSYASGAECMSRLYNARVAHYRRRADRRAGK